MAAQKPIDFLGIGAQKSATTWLWRLLRKHPDVWLPPLKELHYFDRSPAYPTPSYLASAQLRQRLFGRAAHHQEFRQMCVRRMASAVLHFDWQRIQWVARYCFGTYDDDWYLALFDRPDAGVRGEITPAYAILNQPDVEHIRALAPDLKIIFILRNPIERAWSQFRYEHLRIDPQSIHSMDTVIRFMEAPNQTLRSDYIRTLNIWGACFPAEHIYVGFYDDVIQHPARMITDILAFLGVSTSTQTIAAMLDRKYNVSKEQDMPIEVRHYLTQKYYPELRQLCDTLGKHACTWLRDAEAMDPAHADTDV